MSSNLKELFNKYDKAVALNSKCTKFEKDSLIDEIILAAKNKLSERMEVEFSDFGNIVVTKSEGDGNLKESLRAFDFNKESKEATFDFDYEALRHLSGEEVYTVVYSTMSQTLREKRNQNSSQNGYKFGKNVENYQNGNNNSPSLIWTLIKELIKAILGISVDGFTINEIEQDFREGGIVESDLFQNPEQIKGNVSAISGKEVLKRHYEKLVEKGNDEQATYLLGAISKEQFESLKTKDEGKLIDFCKSYITSYMQMFGRDPSEIELNFVHKDNLTFGEYKDNGSSHEIIINLERIKTCDNPMKVITVLSHELKHYFDSENGKVDNDKDAESKGVLIDENNNYGLKDNFVGSIKGEIKDLEDENQEKENDVVSDFILRLQTTCYKVNPNERSAKLGELVGLRFMLGMSTDETTNKYILKSIDDYEANQRTILEELRKVDCQEKIDVIENEFRSLKGSIKNGNTIRFIESRIEYLRDLCRRNKLNTINDEQRLKESSELKNQIGKNDATLAANLEKE